MCVRRLLAAPELRGLSYTKMFRAIAVEAGKRGILVMLACHRMKPDAWPGDGLWYDEQISEHRVAQSWELLAQDLCDVWNVFAVDLQNEPHAAGWGFGRPTDWDRAASRLGNHVLRQCGRWLVMIEGVGYSPGAPEGNDPSLGLWWGGNLIGAREAPVELANMRRLVYSPHAVSCAETPSHLLTRRLPLCCTRPSLPRT